ADFKDIILLQFTGIKDKHGVEIYEGDILKGPMDFGPAGFVESVAPVSYHKINGYQLHYFLLEHTEVIGNVYEDKNIKFGIVEEECIVINFWKLAYKSVKEQLDQHKEENEQLKEENKDLKHEN